VGIFVVEAGLAVVMVTDAVPVVVLRVAVIVADPEATPVARPEELMVAMEVSEEFQVTDEVMSPVVLSAYVAVALNCCVLPAAKLAVGGVTEIEVTVFEVTVIPVDPVTPLRTALIVAVPVPAPVARPAALIVAIFVSDEDQVAVEVTLPVVPSL